VYKNGAAKPVRAFTGQVRFTDLFGKPIYESSLTISDEIAAGAEAKWVGQIEYNQFIDAQRDLYVTPLENMKVEWLPNSILYSDGTSVGKAS
jgi:hypothetical protein